MLRTEYVEDFRAFYDSMKDLFKEHYATCESARSEFEQLDIDVEGFQEAIDKNLCNFLILYDEEDLVGYVNIGIIKSPLLSKYQAIVDYLYILPEMRKKGYTKAIIAELEKEVKVIGADNLNIMLPDKEYSEHVAKGLGYVKTSSIYYKNLGE